MVRRVGWTDLAQLDLDEVVEYIAKDSPHHADQFAQSIDDAALSLCSYSERGRVVPETDDPAVREPILGSYRSIYRVLDEETHILGLMHASRDFHRYWESRSVGD